MYHHVSKLRPRNAAECVQAKMCQIIHFQYREWPNYAEDLFQF